MLSIKFPRWILFTIIGFGLISFGLGRLYFRYTDGFSVAGISAPLSYDPRWDVSDVSSLDESIIQDILQQRFTYLAKGTQSYVLASEDGKYVLKFFKQKHLRFPSWMESMEDLPLLGSTFVQKKARRQAKKEKIFRGCTLAFREMQEDTGVVYVHLNPSKNLLPELVLIDKLGWEHRVNPNELTFYLQRRGEPVFDALERLSDAGNDEALRQALESLFTYLRRRSERGILDPDPNYTNNLGFIDGRACNLDIGNLTKDPIVKNRVEYCRRIADHTAYLRDWLGVRIPSLVGEYDSQMRLLERGETPQEQGISNG